MNEILNKYLHGTLQFTKSCSMHYLIIGPGRWVGLLFLPHRLSSLQGYGIWNQTDPGLDSICSIICVTLDKTT